MNSDQEEPRPITSLVWMCGNVFAVSRDRATNELVIRQLVKPQALPLPMPARVVVLTRGRE